MFGWFRKKSILTENQKKNITEDNSGWFTDSEIIESIEFEMPKNQIKIDEKYIYFHLENMTGIDYRYLPGNPQSIFWYICEKWKDPVRQNNIRVFLETEWGCNTKYTYKGRVLTLDSILYALRDCGKNQVRIMINDTDKQSKKQKKYVFTNKDFQIDIPGWIKEIMEKEDEEEEEYETYVGGPINFEKYDLDPVKFFDNISYYRDMCNY